MADGRSAECIMLMALLDDSLLGKRRAARENPIHDD
jgi:hypothetical protein